MLVRIWSNMNSLLLGMQNGTAILEDSLAASYKTEHTLIMQSRNYGPWCLPKEAENLQSHKCLHMYVYSGFTYICLNSETTKMSFSKWMGKQAHPDSGMLYVCAQLFSHVWLCNPTDFAHQAPLSIRFSQQGYWSGLPFTPLGVGCNAMLRTKTDKQNKKKKPQAIKPWKYMEEL